MKYIVYTDGGARGNPGPAAVGVIIEQVNERGERVDYKKIKIGRRIGTATNNVAEYKAVIAALFYIAELSRENSQSEKILVEVYMDSQLVASQLNGAYKVKDPTLQSLLFDVRSIENQSQLDTRYHIVPREQNAEADTLVNLALDF